MKNKKIFIIIGIIILIAILVGGYFLIKGKNEPKNNATTTSTAEKITISFNTEGGTSVEAIQVEKGSTAELPNTTKEKYNFLGWYLGDTKVDASTKYDKDTTLVAKWEAIPTNAKTFVVTFDSKGGSAVSKLTVQCDKALSLPKNPTKSGYTFVSWADKNGKVISNGAKLACENVTLYANWKKVEEKAATTAKTYSCPSGYTLSGTKCTQIKDASYGCDITHEKLYNGSCYSVRTYKAATCKVNVAEPNTYGHTEIVPGTVIYISSNTFKCVKNKVSTCIDSHKVQGICYEFVETRDAASVCSEAGSGYTYLIGNALYGTVEKGTGAASGCYKPTGKHYYCESGYTLDGTKCTKTIDATAK